MVQRYETYGYDWEMEVYECDAGNLVRYEDYEELERKFKELMAWRVQVLNDAFSFLARAKKRKPSYRNTKTSSRITSSARTVGLLHMWKGWSDGTEIRIIYQMGRA